MMQKVFFGIFFNSFMIASSFISSSYIGDISAKDSKNIEACLSLMRQKYFENQNFLEDDIQVLSVGQKVKIVGLDKVTSHIDTSIQRSTSFSANSVQFLDEYCKGQSFAITSHINEIITGLKKKIPKQFDQKNDEELRSIKQRLQDLEPEENIEFFKKNKKQKDLLLYTALSSATFFVCAIKAHEKEQSLLVKAIGLWYLKFLWDKGVSFYQEDLKFQEKLAEISLKNIAYDVRKEELELRKELKHIIQDELEVFRQKKVDGLDKKLTEYRSIELEKISLTLLSILKQRENFSRKKIMQHRKIDMQELFIQYQKLRSKISSEKEEDNSQLTTQPEKPDGNLVAAIFSKVTGFFGF